MIYFKNKKINYLILILIMLFLTNYSNNNFADNKDFINTSIPRVVLVELFIQSTCSTCPQVEFCLEELSWEYGPEKMILLEEHLWNDGYDTPETNARYDWYAGEGAKGTPDVFINGLTHRISGLACECGDIDDNYLYYKELVDSELTRPSYIELSATKKIREDYSMVIEGRVKNVSNLVFENLVVFGMIYRDCNELGLCYWVRDILPSRNIPRFLPGDVYAYTIVSQPFPEEDDSDLPIHVIVFVQDIKSPTKEVLQALYVQ